MSLLMCTESVSGPKLQSSELYWTRQHQVPWSSGAFRCQVGGTVGRVGMVTRSHWRSELSAGNAHNRQRVELEEQSRLSHDAEALTLTSEKVLAAAVSQQSPETLFRSQFGSISDSDPPQAHWGTLFSYTAFETTAPTGGGSALSTTWRP